MGGSPPLTSDVPTFPRVLRFCSHVLPLAGAILRLIYINLRSPLLLSSSNVRRKFLDFGKFVCENLRSKGYWADYIDPCSGLPMISLNCNKVYSEVDGMECLLNYKAYNAGFCKILTHPRWGSA